MNDQVNDVCLQELERINKEIETVRHQVEQEQRQLSNYQTGQVDKESLSSISPLSQSKTSKGIDMGDRKYVVDNSKPRTDLEYDPLSNFSSDLSSYNSSRREQKLRNGQNLKKVRAMEPCDQKSLSQTQLSRLQSQEPLDEWMDDDILIIDIPPSPQKNGGKGQKHSPSVVESSQSHETIKNTGISVLLDSPLQYSSPEMLDIEEIDNEYTETKSLADVNQSNECDNSPDSGSATVLKKSLRPSGGVLVNLQVEKDKQTNKNTNLTHFDPPHIAGKTNRPQQNVPSNTSLLDKTLAASSGSQHGAPPEQAQNKSHVQSEFGFQGDPPCFSSLNTPSVVPHGQKSSIRIPELIQGKPESCAGQVEHIWSSPTPQSLPTRTAESSASSNQLLEKDDGRVIVIDSSSDDENTYLDMELSDSDPMEECYRIFMEENEQRSTAELPDTPVSWLLMLRV